MMIWLMVKGFMTVSGSLDLGLRCYIEDTTGIPLPLPMKRKSLTRVVSTYSSDRRPMMYLPCNNARSRPTDQVRGGNTIMLMT